MDSSVTPLEMAGVASGLWLGLALGHWGVAGVVTLAVCLLGFVARTLHYGRRIPGRSTRAGVY